jgi:hypothetical protein
MPNSTLLVIGVENYGIIIYDLKKFSVFTSVSVIRNVDY